MKVNIKPIVFPRQKGESDYYCMIIKVTQIMNEVTDFKRKQMQEPENRGRNNVIRIFLWYLLDKTH